MKTRTGNTTAVEMKKSWRIRRRGLTRELVINGKGKVARGWSQWTHALRKPFVHGDVKELRGSLKVWWDCRTARICSLSMRPFHIATT